MFTNCDVVSCHSNVIFVFIEWREGVGIKCLSWRSGFLASVARLTLLGYYHNKLNGVRAKRCSRFILFNFVCY